nr:hypothetical protein [Providencia sp. wls1949]
MPFFFGVQLAPSGRMVCVDCWHFRFRFKADWAAILKRLCRLQADLVTITVMLPRIGVCLTIKRFTFDMR